MNHGTVVVLATRRYFLQPNTTSRVRIGSTPPVFPKSRLVWAAFLFCKPLKPTFHCHNPTIPQSHNPSFPQSRNPAIPRSTRFYISPSHHLTISWPRTYGPTITPAAQEPAGARLNASSHLAMSLAALHRQARTTLMATSSRLCPGTAGIIGCIDTSTLIRIISSLVGSICSSILELSHLLQCRSRTCGMPP